MPAHRASASGGDTAGATTHTASLVPAIGDYWLVACAASGNTELAPTCTDDNGGTYELIDTIVWGASANTGSVFRRTTPFTNTSNTTVTVTTGANTAAVVGIEAVSGMIRFDSTSVRSKGKQENQAASSTPTPVLDQNALTGNFTMTIVFSGDTTHTPNASWTERVEANQATPTTALNMATRNSGFTSASIAYGATSSTVFGSFAIELDSTDVTFAGYYPSTAAEMAAAATLGTWSAGYPCTEASGNLSPNFGSGTFNVGSGTADYQQQGAISASHAFAIESNEWFTATTVEYDITGTEDLVIAILCKPATDTTNAFFWGKGANVNTQIGWRLDVDWNAKTATFRVCEGTGSFDSSTATIGVVSASAWYLIVAVIDRGANKIRVGVRSGTSTFLGASTTPTTSGFNYTAVAVGHSLRGSSGVPAVVVDHFWIAEGASAGSGISAGMQTVVESLWNTLTLPPAVQYDGRPRARQFPAEPVDQRYLARIRQQPGLRIPDLRMLTRAHSPDGYGRSEVRAHHGSGYLTDVEAGVEFVPYAERVADTSRLRMMASRLPPPPRRPFPIGRAAVPPAVVAPTVGVYSSPDPVAASGGTSTMVCEVVVVTPQTNIEIVLHMYPEPYDNFPTMDSDPWVAYGTTTEGRVWGPRTTSGRDIGENTITLTCPGPVPAGTYYFTWTKMHNLGQSASDAGALWWSVLSAESDQAAAWTKVDKLLNAFHGLGVSGANFS